MVLIGPGSVAPGFHLFSILGLDNVDSSSIFIDAHFEDVSFRKAFCWKYFLIHKAKGNEKAKCQVEISKGKYCGKVLSAIGGKTSGLNAHLKNVHGINEFFVEI